MRKLGILIASLVVTVASMATVYAADHPDSETEPLEDGCNRTQLGLLGEAVLTMEGGSHLTAMPSWVYVNGDNRPKTLEGRVLGTHTAGTDLFGVHDTYDVNFDVQPFPAYDHLLSTRNAAENPGQIHTEWEVGLAPLFAWPSAGDRVRETGKFIWDCGHWQGNGREVPRSDLLPGDPLGTAGVEEVGGEAAEIHPISELATWRARGDFVPDRRTTAVHATELDVALSNQGGKALGVENCAVSMPIKQAENAARFLTGTGCSQVQQIAGRDYEYELVPPRRPSPKSVLRVQQDIHYVHRGPAASAVTATVKDGVVHVKVPFAAVEASQQLQDFGGTWHAWWTRDKTPTRRFRVTLESITINNNLDEDSGDTSNGLVDAPGEWNMFVDVNGNWTNLHDTRKGHPDYAPVLGAVPSAKPNPVVIPLATVPSRVVALAETDALHVFTDARECDQPGYVDCPTNNELATTGKSAGRAEITLPVAQLRYHSTRVTIRPPLCVPGQGCGEERNDPGVCPQSCYALTYRVDDITTRRALKPRTVVGDGTRGNTTVASTAAAALSWWIEPITKYGLDQGEENEVVAGVIDRYLRRKGR